MTGPADFSAESRGSGRLFCPEPFYHKSARRPDRSLKKAPIDGIFAEHLKALENTCAVDYYKRKEVMIMKKKLIALIAAAALIFTLAGCGSGSEKTTAKKKATAKTTQQTTTAKKQADKAKTKTENAKKQASKTKNQTSEAKKKAATTTNNQSTTTNKKTTTTKKETAESKYIGVDKATEIALKKAGLSKSKVKFVRQSLGEDDGKAIYEIDFFSGDTQYEFDIDAETGKVLDNDSDYDGD